jgi:hypothetical protein
MPEKINKLFKVFLALTIVVLFLSGFFVLEKKDVEAQSDAIAVRVLANPQHYSPMTWYKSKGFTGSPSPLTVDGYQAVRDGRTVYVNVGNVSFNPGHCRDHGGAACSSNAQCSGSSCDGEVFFTNIYLISYNQNASEDTISVFNKILSNWKFNTNLVAPGVCFIPQQAAKTCVADADCPNPSSCVAGACQQSCLADADCQGGFCSSFKSELIRDVKRLGDINDLKAKIDSYNKRVGHYPLLGSGTYQSGKTISAWPSWNAEFASELGVGSMPVDPINKLGDCGNLGGPYDPVTCWDAKNKAFASGFNIPDRMPAGSDVYAYSILDPSGLSYNACARMETDLVSQTDGACRGSNVANKPPVIDCSGLVGIQGQNFTGYVTAADPENDPLTFTFNTANLPAGINIFDTTDPNKKIITSLTSEEVGKISYQQKAAQVAASDAVLACLAAPLTDLADVIAAQAKYDTAAADLSLVTDPVIVSNLSTSLATCGAAIQAKRAEINSAAALAAATAAVVSCESAVNTMSTAADITNAENLYATANAAVDLVANSDPGKPGLSGRLAICYAAIQAKKASLAEVIVETNATNAVNACLNAPITTFDEITAAQNLCAQAFTPIGLVSNSTVSSALTNKVLAQQSLITTAKNNLYAGLPPCSTNTYASVDLSSFSASCQTQFTTVINAINATRLSANKTLQRIVANSCDDCACRASCSLGPTTCYDPLYYTQFGSFALSYSSLNGGCLTNANTDMNSVGIQPSAIGGKWFIWDSNEGESVSTPCSQDALFLFGCGVIKLPNFLASCGGPESRPITDPPTCRTSLLDNAKYNIAATRDDSPVKIATALNVPAQDYTFDVTVSDGKNSPVTQTCKVSIGSSAFFVYPLANQRVDTGKILNFSIYAYKSDKDYSGITFTFSDPAFKCSKINVDAQGREKCDITFTGTNPQTYSVTVSAAAAGKISSSQVFNIEVYNNPPFILPIDCPKSVRVGQSYSCQLKATDPEGQMVRFLASGFPPGISNGNTMISSAFISGTPPQTSANANPYKITITAFDIPYYAPSQSRDFLLRVNNYCGDGHKDTPNFENKGGIADNGYEDCDCGSYANYTDCANAGCAALGEGVTCTQANSTTGVPRVSEAISPLWQYGCTNNCAAANGGFCGDSIAQDGQLKTLGAQQTVNSTENLLIKHTALDYGEQCDFGGNNNCCVGCKWTTLSTGLLEDVGSIKDHSDNSIDTLPVAKDSPVTIKIPQSRGVTGGSFQATINLPSMVCGTGGTTCNTDAGAAIVFVTDLSGNSYDPNYPMTKAALLSAVDQLSTQAQTNGINIHVGAVATYTGVTGLKVPIGNLGGANGSLQKAALETNKPNDINDYKLLGDDPKFPAAFTEAQNMLTGANSSSYLKGERYIIIMTDGYCGGACTDAAVAAKAAGIKVYSIAFAAWNASWQTCGGNYPCQSLRNLCAWSSETAQANCFGNYSDPATCYSNTPGSGCYTGYAYVVNLNGNVSNEMNFIYLGIVNNILADTPTNITFSVNGGAAIDINNCDLSGATPCEHSTFTLSGINCDISGATPCSPATFTLMPTWRNGNNAKIKFSNFKLKVLPLCSNQ